MNWGQTGEGQLKLRQVIFEQIDKKMLLSPESLAK
jgi:hypothetical protein